MHELLPAVERAYRGIGQGWARGVLGGSTGGWESFAVQVLYPDDFNYAAVACPDPIGFTSYTTVDLYKDANACAAARPDAPAPATAERAARPAAATTTTRRSRRRRGRATATTTAAPR